MLYYSPMKETRPDLSFSIVQKISAIPAEDWNRLFGQDLVESYGYLKTLEEGGTEEFSFGYLVGKEKNRSVLILPFFVMDFSFAMLLPEYLHKAAAVLGRWLEIKLFFAGSPTTEGFSMGLSPEVNLEAALGQALEKLQEFSKSEKILGIAFYNLSAKSLKLAEYLKRKKFIKMETLPTTAINIKAGSLEDYLRGLSRNTRKDIKKKLRRSGEIVQLRTEERLDITDIIDVIYKLYLNNVAAAGVHFETLTRKFFLDICKNMPGVAKYFITYDKDKIVAFNLCLIQDGIFIDKFIGFDYTLAHKYHLYYTTFCHNIAWCIEHKLKVYQPGFSDYHPKIRLGAKLVTLDIYARAFNPILNFIIRLIKPLIEPKNMDPIPKEIAKKGRLNPEETF
ncbi:MAG: GNAT family N-acetyltransferase [Candidatus Omnitrophica bacterium]|nr:GNAT family N-acetyltransferase [Candidatus Omnitrophota bacterium]